MTDLQNPIVLPNGLIFLLTFLKSQPVFAGLITLMCVDVVVGIMLSITKKTLSSTVSWGGMSRKVIMLCLVGTCAVLQEFIPSFPFLNVASAFYTVTEAISILENAAEAGVPLPKGLLDTLKKFREQQQLLTSQKKLPTTNVTNNTTNVTVVPAIPVPVITPDPIEPTSPKAP